jgi:methylase of polypeptide subunit release factors
VLEQAGYTEARVLERLDAAEVPPLALRLQYLPLHARRLQGETPLHTLLWLFLFHQSVDIETAARAVQPTSLEDWVQLGLLRLADGKATAAVELFPYADLLLAIDWPGQSELLWKYVMGPGGSSRSLDLITVRRPAGRSLDVGTGCGVLALRTASHSAAVAAVDKNPRAVHLAAFNAQLNGLDHVRCLEGDFFAPVQGEAFDLIVGNLPFVMSPKTRYLFRDSPLPGDALLQAVVRTSASFLRPGGYAQFLGNWAHVSGQDPVARLAGWFEGTGCDAWVLRIKTQDVADYAADWIAQSEGPDLRESAQELDAWLAYYAHERIEAISSGFLILRSAPGQTNAFRCEDMPAVHSPCGEAIVRRFALHDFLQTVRDDRVLLAARLRAAPDVRWQQELRPADDGWSVIESRLRLARGLGYAGDADRNVVALVMGCQGKEPLRNVLSAIAAARGGTLENIAPASLAVVRRLLADGYLLPPDID